MTGATISKTMALLASVGLAFGLAGAEQLPQAKIRGQVLAGYPQTVEGKPGIASPVVADDGSQWIVAHTRDGRYAVVPVTVGDWRREAVKYFGTSILAVDQDDFPTLAMTGLHAEAELARARTINGRPIAEIDESCRPGRMSSSGFMAEDEDVISVLRGDDRLVRRLGLSHPRLAEPLLHLWNVILQEQKFGLGVWNGGPHAWAHFDHLLYNGRKISYEAHFTKGVQKSPFQDGIEGNSHVVLRRFMEPGEEWFIDRHYAGLPQEKRRALKEMLCGMTTGEIEPFYIVRYGFYEGHTSWRTDPIVIAFIFGLRSLEEIEAAFPGELDEVLAAHFTTGDKAGMPPPVRKRP